MGNKVVLILAPEYEDEYGWYENYAVFNADGEYIGATGGRVPDEGNPCSYSVIDSRGFPGCSALSHNKRTKAENETLRKLLAKTFHELQKALTEEYGGWDDDQTLDLMHEITDAGVWLDDEHASQDS